VSFDAFGGTTTILPALMSPRKGGRHQLEGQDFTLGLSQCCGPAVLQCCSACCSAAVLQCCSAVVL
jgi:hypothetical protein